MIKRPNYQYWLYKPVWRLHQAVALFIGFDPENMPDPHLYPREYAEFRDLLSTATISVEQDILRVEGWPKDRRPGMEVRPLVFLRWAQKTGKKTHPELAQLLELADAVNSDKQAGNIGIDSSPVASKKKATRKRRITTSIERARESFLQKNSREPTCDEIFSSLAENDETGCVVDCKEDALVWQDMSGKLHEITRKTLANRLSEIKKRG